KVGGKRKQQVKLGRVDQSSTSMINATTRVDLRGYRVDEAIEAVTRLIDQALLTGLSDVEILHGTGTGALRKAIHDYLAIREEVATFEEAPWEQGGAGVTYVHLR
ncbi:MAG: Smr/MutS family protein, partial [Rhodothermales bacterium]